MSRYQNLVYSIPRRMGLSQDDADDVFQSTFLSLHRNLDRIDEPQALGKWLAVTATRESLRTKRVAQKSGQTVDEGMALEDLIASEEATAETNAVKAVESDLVRGAILALPSKCRELLTMLYLMDSESYEDVARETGMPIGSIGPTRARCLEKVRSILQKSGFFEDHKYHTSSEASHSRRVQ